VPNTFTAAPLAPESLAARVINGAMVVHQMGKQVTIASWRDYLTASSIPHAVA